MKSSIRRSRRVATAVALGSVLALTATACGDDGSGAGGDKGAEGSGKGKIVFWDNNGGVRTDFPLTVQGRVDRRLDVALNGGGAPIRITTTNGGVHLTR